MTDAEILEWMNGLGNDRDRQIAVIRELLRHANGDQMTPADRTICRRALELTAAPVRNGRCFSLVH